MNRGVRLLPEAKAEFDAAADWYENQRAGLGVASVAKVRQVLDRIADDPRLHAPVYLDIRKAVVPKFPFVILYREEPDEVVVSVFHTSRDPSTWKSRA
jgi:toxin ParE1/3/4